MGHVRLGTLPRSRAWKEVVGLITAVADVSQIANATIRAADKAFSFVLNDEGFTEAVWLMTQLAIAAKKDNFNDHLQSIGINLPQDTSLPDVAASVAEASRVFRYLNGNPGSVAQKVYDLYKRHAKERSAKRWTPWLHATSPPPYTDEIIQDAHGRPFLLRWCGEYRCPLRWVITAYQTLARQSFMAIAVVAVVNPEVSPPMG